MTDREHARLIFGANVTRALVLRRCVAELVLDLAHGCRDAGDREYLTGLAHSLRSTSALAMAISEPRIRQ